VAMLLITAKYFGLDPESMLLMHEEVQKKYTLHWERFN